MDKFVYQDSDGVRRTMIPVDHDNFVVNTEVNMTQVLEGIKIDREHQRPRSMNKTVARVPMTVYEQSLREGWDEGDWKRWLNDPDNAAFRVWQGKV